MKQEPVIIDTLEQFRRYGMRSTIYCNQPDCRHSADLNVGLAIEKLGPDFPCCGERFYAALRCSKCGGRDVSATVLAPGGGRPGRAHSHSQTGCALKMDAQG